MSKGGEREGKRGREGEGERRGGEGERGRRGGEGERGRRGGEGERGKSTDLSAMIDGD